MKKFLLGALSLSLVVPALGKDRVTVDPNAVNTDVILHAWSWNFPEIAANMKKIADAGYTMVQTSPVQNCYAPEGSGKKIFDDNVTEGNWYYYYQPTDWKIGNNILGSKEQMQAMMDSAAKYNVKIIVDVLPNHTAFDIDAVSDDFYKAVGGRDKMFHSNGLQPVEDYNDRLQCTLWASGALRRKHREPGFSKILYAVCKRAACDGSEGIPLRHSKTYRSPFRSC